jgi:hypothetical protein
MENTTSLQTATRQTALLWTRRKMCLNQMLIWILECLQMGESSCLKVHIVVSLRLTKIEVLPVLWVLY